MREIDQDAEAVAFPDDLLSKLGQALVLGRIGLDIAERVARVVDELEMSDAQVVGDFDATCVVLDEARALDGQHDLRLAAQCAVVI